MAHTATMLVSRDFLQAQNVQAANFLDKTAGYVKSELRRIERKLQQLATKGKEIGSYICHYQQADRIKKDFPNKLPTNKE